MENSSSHDCYGPTVKNRIEITQSKSENDVIHLIGKKQNDANYQVLAACADAPRESFNSAAENQITPNVQRKKPKRKVSFAVNNEEISEGTNGHTGSVHSLNDILTATIEHLLEFQRWAEKSFAFITQQLAILQKVEQMVESAQHRDIYHNAGPLLLCSSYVKARENIKREFTRENQILGEVASPRKEAQAETHIIVDTLVCALNVAALNCLQAISIQPYEFQDVDHNAIIALFSTLAGHGETQQSGLTANTRELLSGVASLMGMMGNMLIEQDADVMQEQAIRLHHTATWKAICDNQTAFSSYMLENNVRLLLHSQNHPYPSSLLEQITSATFDTVWSALEYHLTHAKYRLSMVRAEGLSERPTWHIEECGFEYSSPESVVQRLVEQCTEEMKSQMASIAEKIAVCCPCTRLFHICITPTS